MRILDVQMVVVRRDLWISFNVAEAVQEWSQRRRRRHGLEVNVIDSQGFPIDAKAVFGNVDCTLPVGKAPQILMFADIHRSPYVGFIRQFVIHFTVTFHSLKESLKIPKG